MPFPTQMSGILLALALDRSLGNPSKLQPLLCYLGTVVSVSQIMLPFPGAGCSLVLILIVIVLLSAHLLVLFCRHHTRRRGYQEGTILVLGFA